MPRWHSALLGWPLPSPATIRLLSDPCDARVPHAQINVPSYKVIQEHYDSKHPKETCPSEEQCMQAAK